MKLTFFDTRLLKIFIAGFFAFVLSSAALAENTAMSVAKINAWYAALSPPGGLEATQAQIAALLSDDAMIELKDLNTTQTKAQFVESLEGWVAAIEQGSVAHKIQPGATMENVTALVCYDFGGNALMTREVFDIAAMRITRSVQETIAERCDDF